ncbi:armadillo/beta-catenin-like repeat family protein [Tasmannia lanceolata]|uniref:armadillo/beta-catenin-like repeat family protein n=1 Tax=Tasmannia lanceolata TaxID=3420 RepID=UPI004064C2B2
MSLPEGTNSIVNLARYVLTSISEVTTLVVGINIEQENLMEVGCYLHRTSPAIMELQMTENAPPNAIEILQSLSNNVDLAKDLVGKCSTEVKSIMDLELKSIIEQLESVIRSIGESLSLIPSSTFNNHTYAEYAVRSLSREMQNARLPMSGTQIYDPEEEKVQNVSSKEMEISEHIPVMETDLYSIPSEAYVENSLVLKSDGESGELPHLADFLGGFRYNRQDNSSQPLKTLPQVAEYMEPLYETFCCPLTKEIMNDPVTIGSGVTYERTAIDEWFKRCENCSEDIVCPTTGKKLESRALNTNMALKITIEEWKERNEVARIKVARAALSVTSSVSVITEALKDMQHLCRRKGYNKVQIRNVGMIPLLVRLLEYGERKVRCETLETLRLLSKDEEGKEMIAKTKAIKTTIKMLSSDYPLERHLALSFLLELSRHEPLCEKIGSVHGGILILITMKYNKSFDALAAEKAEGTLKNLEKCRKNIKYMAENGLLEPLLNHLIEGSEEMQMEMGIYLGEIVLENDTKTYVAERASAALVNMVRSGNTLTRKVAFKALLQISSYLPNGKVLVDAGIVPIMTEEMFTRKIDNEPMNTEKESSAILANILESGLDLETLQVNTHGRTMVSDYITYNIIHMLKNSVPDELNVNLIRILLCLTKSPKAMANIISVIKETDTSYTLIQLINSPKEQLSIVSTKLLISVSPFVGHTIADQLCKSRGQPENLIKKLENDRITEKHAVWMNLLAKLPHQNLTLNVALLRLDVIPIILQRIHEIQRGEARTSKFGTSYLEGLVGILVRFTTTLYDPQILLQARNHNLAAVFTELLIREGSGEVQRLSAIGLEKLSSESIHLSKTPQIKKSKFQRILPKCFHIFPSHVEKLPLCPIHRGQCSSRTTFCLLDSRSLERLLECLNSENVEVVEAALSAICTLLDEKVDVDKSVCVLSEVNVIQHVLNVLREHKQEGIWQKSFWVIERFLMKGDSSVSDISQDRLLPSTLVSALHHGDSRTKQMAEKILKHLNRTPSLSTNVLV